MLCSGCGLQPEPAREAAIHTLSCLASVTGASPPEKNGFLTCKGKAREDQMPFGHQCEKQTEANTGCCRHTGRGTRSCMTTHKFPQDPLTARFKNLMKFKSLNPLISLLKIYLEKPSQSHEEKATYNNVIHWFHTD